MRPATLAQESRVASQHGRSDPELHRGRARKARSGVPRGAASPGEALHVDARRPREVPRKWREPACECGVLVRSDDPRTRPYWQAEDVVDVR